ncbi:MAG: N-acetylmuramoyl-L-alanine amidase [Bacteroidales bacterium]|nr:N-acetylmuramoyl-L-alanine amidase [Bacteroidales bacterium]
MKHAICIALSLLFSAIFAPAQNNTLKLSTVVIDAGHGGKDAGAVSKDSKTYEKNLALDIANRLATRIRAELPSVKVVQTRSTDVFVELRERAAIANRAGANLFVSIHINSNKSTSPNGYSVHILGQSSNKDRDLFAYNMDVVSRENSVILLEDDYKTNYQGFNPSDPESYIFLQLMQNAYLEQSLLFASTVSQHLEGGPIKANRGISQNPFYVLWKTAMPAVLVELGFISNQADLAELLKEESRQDIADRLFEAFKEYKAQYDGTIDLTPGEKRDPAAAKPEAKPSETPVVQPEQPTAVATTVAQPASPVLYGTQIFATSRPLEEGDPRFLGWKPEVVRLGSLYKYIIGVSSSPDQARKNNVAIREEYPGSFMVSISDGVTTRFK